MKDRIMQIMRAENMTQQEFAQTLDISPASLSSIFTGRTNPTNNHVQAIHRCFPNINVNWLMFGEGEMYVDNNLVSEGTSNESRNPVPVLDAKDAENTVSDTPIYNKVNENVSRTSSSNHDPLNSDPTKLSGHVYPEPNVAPQIIKETVKYIDKPQRKITEIRIFFDDGTYEVFNR